MAPLLRFGNAPTQRLELTFRFYRNAKGSSLPRRIDGPAAHPPIRPPSSSSIWLRMISSKSRSAVKPSASARLVSKLRAQPSTMRMIVGSGTSRISATDRAQITERIVAGWARGVSVDHSFAVAWDAGVMLASRRSWWRIAAALADQSARPPAPTRQTATAPRSAPVLEATGPGQVWSWDITDLRSPWRGVAFKAYSIIDIYSRKLVGHRVEEREADHLAVQMFQTAFAAHGLPGAVHAPRGEVKDDF